MKKGFAPFSADRKGYHISWDSIPTWVCTQCGEPYFEAEIFVIGFTSSMAACVTSAFEGLEPYDGKLSRTILWGQGAGRS